MEGYEINAAVKDGAAPTIYDLVPTDREIAIYPGAKNLLGEKEALRMLARGDLLCESRLKIGRSEN